MGIPKTVLSTRMTGSARETEGRIRALYQRRRRPAIALVVLAALAAALCLRAFVLADGISRQVEATDHAVLWAESAADTLKARKGDLAQAAAELGGNLDGQRWIIPLDETWQETAEEPTYTLTVQPVESDQPLLGKAQIDVAEKNGDSLFSLEVCWQEAGT